mgnify:FL=1
MSRDEIMAMAREAGFRTGQINLSNGPPVPFIAPASGTNCMVELERFAALVAAAERGLKSPPKPRGGPMSNCTICHMPIKLVPNLD